MGKPPGATCARLRQAPLPRLPAGAPAARPLPDAACPPGPSLPPPRPRPCRHPCSNPPDRGPEAALQFRAGRTRRPIRRQSPARSRPGSGTGCPRPPGGSAARRAWLWVPGTPAGLRVGPEQGRNPAQSPSLKYPDSGSGSRARPVRVHTGPHAILTCAGKATDLGLELRTAPAAGAGRRKGTGAVGTGPGPGTAQGRTAG